MLMEPRTDTTPWPMPGAGGARVALPRLAAEGGATYAAAPVSPTAGRLDHVAGLAEQRDRLMGELLSSLVAAAGADDLAEVTGGMSLHVWLQHVGRCTHGEAREVLGAVEVLRSMPATLAGLGDRWLSWSQTAAICRAARRVPVGRRGELDDLVGGAMLAHRDWEPDALVADVWQWVDALQPTRLEQAEAAAERGRFLSLQPNLFGGGSIYGEYDTVGFATLAEALDAPLGPPVAVPDDLLDDEAVESAFDRLDAQRRAMTRQHGRAMADRLLALCEADLAGRTGAPDTDGADRPAPRPLLLATLDVDALLDATRTPGWLLHTLAGGHMRVSASTLQRLVDARGADLRTVVLDDMGEIVGVGTKTRVAPGWMREAAWARDITVRDPEGTCPVRRADLDHIVPWPDGATEVDNLQPLGRRWHNVKTSKAWTVARARDGTTIWRHRRHDWRITLAPPRRDLADVPDPGPPRLPLDHLDAPTVTGPEPLPA